MFYYNIDEKIQNEINGRIEYHRKIWRDLKENPSNYVNYSGHEDGIELHDYIEYHRERSFTYVVMFNEMNRLIVADDKLNKSFSISQKKEGQNA
jgi:hypothetical protein